jgi:hypothetical protein
LPNDAVNITNIMNAAASGKYSTRSNGLHDEFLYQDFSRYDAQVIPKNLNGGNFGVCRTHRGILL